MTPSPPATPRSSATVLVLRDADAQGRGVLRDADAGGLGHLGDADSQGRGVLRDAGPGSPEDLRDAHAGGLEVLLVRRREGSGFAAGHWVFPGGVVDPVDQTLPTSCRRAWAGGVRSERLRATPAQTLGWHVAGVRETFEEAGLLLARRYDGSRPDLGAIGADAVRRALIAREIDAGGFVTWLSEAGLVCDLDALAPYRRMVTPQRAPQRFDTLFLLAAAPEGQEATVDGHETTQLRWVEPVVAVREAQAGNMAMIHPTIRALEGLADVPDVEAALARGHRGSAIPPVLPHIDVDADDRPRRLLEPGDDGYPLEALAHEYAEWADLREWKGVPAWSR